MYATCGASASGLTVNGLRFERVERILRRRLFVSERAGNQPRHRFHHHRGREFPAAQHEVPDGNLVGRQVLGDALVHSLVTPTDQRQARLARKLPRHGLAEEASLRRQQHHGKTRAFGAQRLHGAEKRLGLEPHARPATNGPIVHSPMAVVGKLPQVAEVDLHLSARDGAHRVPGRMRVRAAAMLFSRTGGRAR